MSLILLHYVPPMLLLKVLKAQHLDVFCLSKLGVGLGEPNWAWWWSPDIKYMGCLNFLFSWEAHWGEIDLYVSKHILARLKRREITKGSTNMSSWYRMVLQLPIEWTRSTMSSHMHIHRFTIWYICMMP